MTMAGARPPTRRPPASRSPRWSTRARAGGQFSRGSASTRSPARGVAHVHGRLGVEAIDVIDAQGRKTKIECDALAVSGGWNPAVHLTCHLGGKPVWNEQLAAFAPGHAAAGMHVAGAANGALTLGRVSLKAAPAGAMAAIECGFTVAAARGAARGRRACRRDAAVARQGKPRQGVRGFPERRDHEGHRARRPGRLRRGRASQALHHARHGDRSGQDLERHGPRDPRRERPAAQSPRSAPRPIGRLTCR